MRWNAAVATHGILSFRARGSNNRDIITKYQSISSANILDAFAACTKDCTIQNSKSFYAMLPKSITGTIFNTVFDQVQNLPADKDIIALFKIFTLFSSVASLLPSILSYKKITSLLLSTYDYVIPTINTKLVNLFLCSHAHPHPQQCRTDTAHTHCVLPHQATDLVLLMVHYQDRRFQRRLHHHLSELHEPISHQVSKDICRSRGKICRIQQNHHQGHRQHDL